MLVLLVVVVAIIAAACAPAPTATPAPTVAPKSTEAPKATAAAAGPLAATKAGYPNKTITILAPANPGGGWDQTSRLMQQAFTTEKIVPVAVEVTNKGGAAGTIGLAEFAAKKDPYTMMTMGLVMVGGILTNKSAVTLKDTVPLARLTGEYEVIAVPTNSKYKTMQELVADFKKDPKSISWAGGSAGGTDHILIGLIAQAVGVDIKNVNYVAFAGGGESAAAIIGGQVTAGVSGYGEWKAQVDAGKMRFLAVSSEKKIGKDSTPTLKESGIDVALSNWRGIVASPGIDADTRAWLIEALTRMRNSKSWQDTVAKNEWDDLFLTGDEYGKFLETENTRITQVLKAIGLIQ
ncbi:MAG: tripartite tricarboxylate transporter substrate binding protein [Chloroflexi bacterium]|nr:tripartite tricarboxylate transporter substrate binding protein [Chloroflexota bacterium]